MYLQFSPCPPAKESYSAFLQAGRVGVRKTLNTKAYSVSRSDSKTRGFFFPQYLTIFPQHTSTETHSRTPARTQFVVVKQLWQYIRFLLNVFSIVWSCMYILIVILSFSNSFVPVTVIGHRNSTAPTEGGLMGLLLLKPHILGAVVRLSFFLLLKQIFFISVWLNQLGHIACVWGLVYVFKT